jgi:glycosyltransferase involved in cell wall biosynthesis
VVIPAHNEERYLPACLDAVRVAAARFGRPVEMLVVLNRCTDRSREAAEERGARCVEDQSRCLSTVRNRGIAAASAPMIVTCDADSRIHPDMLIFAEAELKAGAVGGGVPVRFDRVSTGIRATQFFLDLSVWLTGVSCGAFWATREAMDGVGGFDEGRPMGEDVHFAQKLKRWGKARGLAYRTLAKAPLVTSSRKFDAFGDWSFFRMLLFDAAKIRRSLKGKDTEFVDTYFYDFNDREDQRPAHPKESSE